MVEHTPLYYARDGKVFKSPVKNVKLDGKTSTTLGFAVCTASGYVEADDIAVMLIAAEGVEATSARIAALEKENALLRTFAESFDLVVTDSYYKDVYFNLHKPHSLTIRIRNDSSKSWLFADLEERRVAALASTEAMKGE